jgi:hypothetical protein
LTTLRSELPKAPLSTVGARKQLNSCGVASGAIWLRRETPFLQKDDLVIETGQQNINEEALTDAAGNLRAIVTRKRLGAVMDLTASRERELEHRRRSSSSAGSP